MRALAPRGCLSEGRGWQASVEGGGSQARGMGVQGAGQWVEWSPFHASLSPREGHSGAPALAGSCCLSPVPLPGAFSNTRHGHLSCLQVRGETQSKRSLAVGLEACSRAAGCLEGSTLAVWDHSVGPLWAGCMEGTELEEGAIRAGPGGTSLGRKPRERCGSSLAVPKGGHHSSRQADDSWRETQPSWSRTSENPLKFRD